MNAPVQENVLAPENVLAQENAPERDDLPPTLSQSVLYADDNTDNACDKNPDILITKIQHEANLSTSWVADNRLVCSGGKTKLLLIATDAMCRARLAGKQFQIIVSDKIVKESVCERILGVLVNNRLTWHHHLHGDNSDPKKFIPGLITKLSQRVGMLA